MPTGSSSYAGEPPTAGALAGVRDGAATVYTALVLGIAGRRTLHALDAALYHVHSHYRTDAHNLRGLMPWEEQALHHFPASGRVVIVGAGGGRETIALARRGLHVDAFECHAGLRSVAERLLRESGVGATIRPLARDEAPPRAAVPYDAAIAGWSSYMLMIGRATRITFLTRLRRTLAAHAPVLLSFFTRRTEDERLARIARYANSLRRGLGRPPVELGDDLAPTFVHRFTAPELDAELHEAGFRLLHFAEQGSGPEDSGWAVASAVDAPPAAATTEEG